MLIYIKNRHVAPLQEYLERARGGRRGEPTRDAIDYALAVIAEEKKAYPYRRWTAERADAAGRAALAHEKASARTTRAKKRAKRRGGRP